MAVENEISYSINFSQDLLYIILDSYISKNFEASEQYYDFVDENDVRTRLNFTTGQFTSTQKVCTSLKKIVYVHDNILVPFVDRRCVENESIQKSATLKRIVKCVVYKSAECAECEIKFEHVYFNKTLVDRFDSLMASKQIALWNLLQNKNERMIKESHLGSDEILAALRLEYEYNDHIIDDRVLSYMAELIYKIDSMTWHQNISPLLPYTTLQNNILYRKFEDEKIIDNKEADKIEIYKWALKLDGTRGKGFFTKNFMIVFMDDMQMYSSSFENKIFALNNVVAFQCEMMERTLYITDLLHVFKYSYNNQTQYEVSIDPYHIEPADAVDCIDRLAKKFNNDSSLSFNTICGTRVDVKFQQFFDPPIETMGYSTMPVDGFIVLDSQMNYVKYKHYKTVEIEYDDEQKLFSSLNGPLTQQYVTIDDSVDRPLQHQAIYEAIVNDNSIYVLKHRPDRLIPN